VPRRHGHAAGGRRQRSLRPAAVDDREKAHRQQEGIPIAEGVEREFREVARELGISFP
jgi:hypothetical protein